MADSKISALAAVVTPAGSDEFAVNQGGTSKKITLAQIDTFVESLKGFGALHSETGDTDNTSSTPIKIVGTHALSGLEQLFDEPVDGRLRYTGAITLTFRVAIHFSFTSNVNNIILLLEIAKNGSVITASGSQRKIGTGTDLGSLSVEFLVSLATNDYVEAFLDTNTGNPTITTAHLNLIANSMN